VFVIDSIIIIELPVLDYPVSPPHLLDEIIFRVAINFITQLICVQSRLIM